MEINDINSLDDLLSGNTTDTTNKETEAPADEDIKPDDDTTPEGDDTTGGDPDLEASKDDKAPKDDGQEEKPDPKVNAAFARMRVENQNYQKTIKQIAEALGIEGDDPNKMGETLVDMAHKKLAEKQNIPVELFKDYQQTKDQLSAMQMEQNRQTARAKFAQVKSSFELDDDAVVEFARQLDADGINLINNPEIDIEYEYYRRNRAALEQKKIQAAVEEAIRKQNTASDKSTTPSKQVGKPKDDSTPARINNVAALDGLLEGK